MAEQNTREPRISKPVMVLSFISIAMVFSTMVVGRYLSSTVDQQGLACPSWPLCPNEFGPPDESYATEYVHRVLAVIASALVYATAIAVPSGIRRAKRASIIAAIVVSAQIVIGYLTVTTDLYPPVVATHLSTGITVIAFSLLTFLWIGMLRKYWD